MIGCLEADTFFGWFYEHPETWADHETVARFSESCKKYRDYVNQLDGEAGRELKSIATQWVLESGTSRIHDSRIIKTSINMENPDNASGRELTLVLSRRDGAVVEVHYTSVIMVDLPSFQRFVEWEQTIDEHELLLGKLDGMEHIIHNLHFAGHRYWTIRALHVSFNEINGVTERKLYRP